MEQLNLFEEATPVLRPKAKITQLNDTLSTKQFKYKLDKKELIVTDKKTGRVYRLAMRGWHSGESVDIIKKTIEQALNTVVIYYSRAFFNAFMTDAQLENEYQQLNQTRH
jgi:hypothetical protein